MVDERQERRYKILRYHHIVAEDIVVVDDVDNDEVVVEELKMLEADETRYDFLDDDPKELVVGDEDCTPAVDKMGEKNDEERRKKGQKRTMNQLMTDSSAVYKFGLRSKQEQHCFSSVFRRR